MPTPPVDDLAFLGLDAEVVSAVKRLIVNAVAEGMDEGAQRIGQRYGATAKWQVAASVVTAAAAVGILIVLLAGD